MLRDYKSGTVRKKRDSAVLIFGTCLEKIGESVSVQELRQVGSAFWGKLFALLEERGRNDPWSKARLARSLGGFARREQRNQVWDDASVYLVGELTDPRIAWRHFEPV